MSKVRLYGDTSGFVDLKAPDVASNVTITLPNTTGPFATETYVDSAVAAIPGIGSNVVQTVKTDVFSTTSLSLVDVTGLSVTITPTSATSKILVVLDIALSNSNSDAGVTYAQLLRDATEIYKGADGTSINSTAYARDNSGSIVNPTKFYLDSPATASAVTYKVQIAVSANTGYVNRRALSDAYGVPSSLTAIEVAV